MLYDLLLSISVLVHLAAGGRFVLIIVARGSVGSGGHEVDGIGLFLTHTALTCRTIQSHLSTSEALVQVERSLLVLRGTPTLLSAYTLAL